jgi:hypothetical protein
MSKHMHLRGSIPVVVCFSALLIAACGGSSKPSYCSKVSDLEKTVKDLPNVNVIQNGTSALTSALQKVQSDVEAVASSAKSDFPNETSALTSSLDGLAQSVKSLPSSPTPAQVATIVSQASSTVTAVQNFTKATSSKCG